MSVALDWLQSQGLVRKVWKDGSIEYEVTEEGIVAVEIYKQDKQRQSDA